MEILWTFLEGAQKYISHPHCTCKSQQLSGSVWVFAASSCAKYCNRTAPGNNDLATMPYKGVSQFEIILDVWASYPKKGPYLNLPANLCRELPASSSMKPDSEVITVGHDL